MLGLAIDCIDWLLPKMLSRWRFGLQSCPTSGELAEGAKRTFRSRGASGDLETINASLKKNQWLNSSKPVFIGDVNLGGNRATWLANDQKKCLSSSWLVDAAGKEFDSILVEEVHRFLESFFSFNSLSIFEINSNRITT